MAETGEAIKQDLAFRSCRRDLVTPILANSLLGFAKLRSETGGALNGNISELGR